MWKSKQSLAHELINGTQTNKKLVKNHGRLLDIPRNQFLTTNTNSTGFGNENSCSKPLELTKLLLNVNVQKSLGTVQVVMKPNDTVKDLITAAIGVYVKEKRRPFLGCHNSMCFELHHSQFSLECLNWEEKLIDLGSRNFFICHKHNSNSTTSTFCCNELEKRIPFSFPLTKFIDFLL